MGLSPAAESRLRFFRLNIFPFWKSFVIVFAPIILSPIPAIVDNERGRCGYVILVMAVYWMTDALPLAVTALIPVFAFPLMGVLSTGEVCLSYMKSTNMMFLGGLMVAVAVEHSNLHTRIALAVIINVGQSPRRLMCGFIITTMFLSMWISNTASTAMMVPIVEAILLEITQSDEHETSSLQAMDQNGISNVAYDHEEEQVKTNNQLQPANQIDIEDSNEDASEKSKSASDLRTMCFLAVAYAANIGGTGTITGTAPNLVVKNTIDSSFTDPTELNFGSWMLFNVPGMLLCCFFAWVWLQYLFIGFGKNSKLPKLAPERQERIKDLLVKKYQRLGSMTFHETAVLTLFVGMVAAWLLRQPGFMAGWTIWFKHAFGEDMYKSIKDASPAILTVFFLFVVPSKINFWPFVKASDSKALKPSEGCLTWDVIHEKVPWDIVLLIGGGFAMATASEKSGLSLAMGESMRSLSVLPSPVIVFIICLLTAMVTEVASNTATASILMPILKELSLGICVNPLYLMVPTAVCASYAFMLPVATAPNAIVYKFAKMKTIDMMRAGFFMNIVCIIVVNIVINTLGIAIFDVYHIPTWLNSSITGDPMCS